ncbi:hypothetical protein [Pseudoalteromonas maricaloris]|uniref:hypothetical protein n=1 Tax=Pseudoalteromonas maricaloris TaxID=184924 RepID=UPI003C150D33
MNYVYYTKFSKRISPDLYRNKVLPYFKSQNFNEEKSFWFECFGLNLVKRYLVDESDKSDSFEESELADKSKYLVIERRMNARKRLDIFFYILPFVISFFILCTVVFNSEELFGMPIWLGLIIFMLWNIVVCNFIYFYRYKLSLKNEDLVYLDRANNTINFTEATQSEPPLKDEFGNAAFPVNEFSVNARFLTKTQGTGKIASLVLIHENIEQYNRVPWVHIHALSEYHGTVEHVTKQWARYQRYLDLSLPLPDSPDMELHRNNEPLTKEFDVQNKRPERFWCDFSYEQQTDIETEIGNDAFYNEQYQLSKKLFDTYDLVSPWIQFKASKSKEKVSFSPLVGNMLVSTRQLLIGI